MGDGLAGLAALQLACAERVEHRLFQCQLLVGGALHTVDGVECGLIVVVVHVPLHEVVGHLRHILRAGESLEKLLEHRGRIAEGGLAPLHLSHGEIVESGFHHGFVAAGHGGLFERHAGGIVVAELHIGLADKEIGTLTHGCEVLGHRSEAVDSLLIFTVAVVGDTEDIECRRLRLGGGGHILLEVGERLTGGAGLVERFAGDAQGLAAIFRLHIGARCQSLRHGCGLLVVVLEIVDLCEIVSGHSRGHLGVVRYSLHAASGLGVVALDIIDVAEIESGVVAISLDGSQRGEYRRSAVVLADAEQAEGGVIHQSIGRGAVESISRHLAVGLESRGIVAFVVEQIADGHQR